MAVSFTQGNYIVDEGGTWKTQAIAVERTGDVSGSESCKVSIFGSTSENRATRGSDYQTSSQEFNWSDGESGQKQVYFQPLSDNESEVIEYATCYLYTGDNTTEGTYTSARIYIIDQELKPTGDTPPGSGKLELSLIAEGIDGKQSRLEAIDYIQRDLVYKQQDGILTVFGRLAATNIRVKDAYWDEFDNDYEQIYHRIRIGLGIRNTVESLGAKLPVGLTVGRSRFFNLRNQNRTQPVTAYQHDDGIKIYPEQWLKNDNMALGTTRLIVDSGKDYARMEFFNGWTYLDEPVLMSDRPAEIDLIFSGIIPGELVNT